MAHRIGIIDYGVGNIYSIQQVCAHFGHAPVLCSTPESVQQVDSLILPGVGAFGDAMAQLSQQELIEPIREFALQGKPLMGICLGMQLLFNGSEEFGEHKGLGLIEGEICKFPAIVNGRTLKIPQIGWNRIFGDKDKWGKSPLKGLEQGEFMYFVHSYYAKPANHDEMLTETIYEDFRYCSSFQKNNIFAFQFHPERSGEKGINIYNNFLSV